MTQQTQKVVGIYIRVSTEKQVQEGFSLDAQKDEDTQFAKKLFGDDVVLRYYVDEGKSAKSTKSRYELQRMMKDVKHGLLSTIITYKVSRLSRNLSDSLKLVDEIHKAKVRFISIKEGEYGTPHGNLQFNILASVAQYQREDLAENVQFGMSRRAREGKFNGGRVLGYDSKDKKLVVNTEEAEIVNIIFDKFVNDGWGTKKIAHYLNTIGKHTKNGKSFSVNTVSIILDNPIYKGYTRYNQVINWESQRRKGTNPDYILAKGLHEAIIDEAIWNKAKELRERKSTGTPRQYSGSFPLTSLAKCPKCGSYMTSLYGAKRKDGTRKRYYVCGEYHNKGRAVCNPNTICADWLENAVFERLREALMSDKIIKEITDRINLQIREHPASASKSNEVIVLKKQLDDYESRKRQIQELIETGVYTIDEAKERMFHFRSKIEETNKLLDSMEKEQYTDIRILEPITPEQIKLQLKEFLELKELLSPLEFRQLLVASIIKIEASKKELKHIHFSFIAHLPENEKDQGDPSLHIHPQNTPFILRGLNFKENHYLFMIRFPPIYPKRPINLLHQYQPHQLMRECHLRE
ncbi:recombinase family protein [Falsibacillus pallidus]|uniref:Site-specific DNA recombinase n=1 Tax=Falsibacillus pallidus TaxID=493781 RepID=A0A370GEQ8_9BACI|nr:recombinase family protein [Falsibacillus pallidus]RDI40904.1 site-specific DNA recombinase [Falsibacillus pallidus]